MNTYDALNAFQKKPPSNESKTLYSHQRWVSGIFPAIILSVVTNAFCATHSTNGSSSEDIQYTEVTNPANRKPSRLGSIFQRLCSWIGKSDKQEDSISSDSEEESEHIEKPRHRNLSGKSDISTVAELEKAQMKGYLSKERKRNSNSTSTSKTNDSGFIDNSPKVATTRERRYISSNESFESKQSMLTPHQELTQEEENRRKDELLTLVVEEWLDDMMADADFILPIFKWGENTCANVTLNLVKLFTCGVAAIACPFNSIFISNAPLLDRLMAAMGTVPLSMEFNLELIQTTERAYHILKKRGVKGWFSDWLKDFKSRLESSHTIGKAGDTTTTFLFRPAAATVGGAMYAWSDALSAQLAGEHVAGLAGASEAGKKTTGYVTGIANFYYTDLSGAIFYVGLVNQINDTVFHFGKNQESIRLSKVIERLNGFYSEDATEEKLQAKEKAKNYIEKIKMSSIKGILELGATNNGNMLVDSPFKSFLFNIIPLIGGTTAGLMLAQCNVESFSAKRQVLNACQNGLTVFGTDIWYDQRVALNIGSASSECCGAMIDALSGNSSYSGGSCVTEHANITMLPTSDTQSSHLEGITQTSEVLHNVTEHSTFAHAGIQMLERGNFTSIAETTGKFISSANSTLIQTCQGVTSSNCHLELLPPTVEALEKSAASGWASGYAQGLGLWCAITTNCLTATNCLYNAFFQKNRVKRIPPSVWIYRALGYGEMAVFLYFYSANVWAVVPITAGFQIIYNATKNKDQKFDPSLSGVISLLSLNGAFISGGEFMARATKTGVHYTGKGLKFVWHTLKGLCGYAPHSDNPDIHCELGHIGNP